MQQLAIRETHKPLDEIMAYQNDRVIQRYMVDYDASREVAEKCFTELKRFMLACAVKTGYKATSQPIDSMCHIFILYTKAYKEFCEEYLGRFIHHDPYAEVQPHIYFETRTFIADFYGSVDEDFWPMEEAKRPCVYL